MQHLKVTTSPDPSESKMVQSIVCRLWSKNQWAENIESIISNELGAYNDGLS